MTDEIECPRCYGRKVAFVEVAPGVSTRGDCPRCQGKGTIPRPWRGYELPREKLTALFAMADLQVVKVWEIPNGYWTADPMNPPPALPYPWYLVRTNRDPGLIEIGWRKRVISIDWSDTAVRGIVTQDDVTKDEDCVHAYSYDDAVKYLRQWRVLPISAVSERA